MVLLCIYNSIMNTKEIGDISESAVVTQLLKCGLSVSIPFGDRSRYDLILDDGKKLHKVQVKTAQYLKDKLIVRAYSISTKEGKTIKNTYSNDVDFIAAYCHELDKVYIIPIAAVGNGGVITLRLADTKNNQKNKVTPAEQFVITNVL